MYNVLTFTKVYITRINSRCSSKYFSQGATKRVCRYPFSRITEQRYLDITPALVCRDIGGETRRGSDFGVKFRISGRALRVKQPQTL